jgi:hypothetical protein
VGVDRRQGTQLGVEPEDQISFSVGTSGPRSRWVSLNQVEALEFLGIIECAAHRVGLRVALVQDFQVQLLGSPHGVGLGPRHGVRAGVARERAFGVV